MNAVKRSTGSVSLFILAAVAPIAVARDARAGEFQTSGILAATDDGVYAAEYEASDGLVQEEEKGKCGMYKVSGRELAVHARCTLPGSYDLLPLEKWTWIDPTPEVRRLRRFDEAAAKTLARNGFDLETGATFAEIFHGGAWIRVRVFEDDRPQPAITGAIKGSDRYVVRLNYAEDLSSGDEIWAPTFAEVADESGRYERAHKEAQEDTARMREHRKRGDAVFAPPPAGTKKEKWEQRRRHGMARFLRKWEIVRVFRPWTAADLNDALWLLAWLDSPRRRYESLRVYDVVRASDPKGAAGVVEALASDPDTRALAEYLKTTKDYLRGLPAANEEMTPAMLSGLSSEQLLWLHRSIQVRARYQLEDPVVRQYFEGFGGYSPMSDRAWKKLTSDPAWKKNPDAVLFRALANDAIGKHNLELIIQAEARLRASPR
jgi:hypothetical protein